MSTSFQEFLEKKASEELPDDRRQQVTLWVESVERLIAQLRAWLRASDPKGLLNVTTFEIPKIERGLGEYTVHGLSIKLGSAEVKVMPVGRNVVGTIRVSADVSFRAEGRVDLTDGSRKFIFYRRLDTVEEWYAIDDNYDAAALNPQRFELLLQELLS